MDPDGKIGKSGGYGLISMRERALGQNGKFEVQSEKGEGTMIKVSFRLHRRSARGGDQNINS